jgi:adenylate cyclase
MLSIFVSSRTDREHIVHREGPLEFGRGPQREVPRRMLKDPAVSNNQLSLQERLVA